MRSRGAPWACRARKRGPIRLTAVPTAARTKTTRDHWRPERPRAARKRRACAFRLPNVGGACRSLACHGITAECGGRALSAPPREARDAVPPNAAGGSEACSRFEMSMLGRAPIFDSADPISAHFFCHCHMADAKCGSHGAGRSILAFGFFQQFFFSSVHSSA